MHMLNFYLSLLKFFPCLYSNLKWAYKFVCFFIYIYIYTFAFNHFVTKKFWNIFLIYVDFLD